MKIFTFLCVILGTAKSSVSRPWPQSEVCCRCWSDRPLKKNHIFGPSCWQAFLCDSLLSPSSSWQNNLGPPFHARHGIPWGGEASYPVVKAIRKRRRKLGPTEAQCPMHIWAALQRGGTEQRWRSTVCGDEIWGDHRKKRMQLNTDKNCRLHPNKILCLWARLLFLNKEKWFSKVKEPFEKKQAFLKRLAFFK